MARKRTSVMNCDVRAPVYAVDFLGIKIRFSEHCQMAFPKPFPWICPGTTKSPIPSAQQGLRQPTRTHPDTSWSAPWSRTNPHRPQWLHRTQALEFGYLKKSLTFYHGDLFAFNGPRRPATHRGHQSGLASTCANDTSPRWTEGFGAADHSPVSANTLRFKRRYANAFEIAVHSSPQHTKRGLRLFQSEVTLWFSLRYNTRRRLEDTVTGHNPRWL